MLQENENRLRALVCNEALARQILDLIQEDEAARHAELIRRQSEGLKRARANGVRLGRPPAKKPRKFQNVYNMYLKGEVSIRAASQMLNVSPGTFKRWSVEEAEKAKAKE
ncbi:MAG: hypothetical protein LUG45_00775 [Clostridiales bacterium]|nr:hypothetical protein [Clostridiales bacterium]